MASIAASKQPFEAELQYLAAFHRLFGCSNMLKPYSHPAASGKGAAAGSSPTRTQRGMASHEMTWPLISVDDLLGIIWANHLG